MSYKRLILLVMSILLAIPLLAFIGIMLIRGDMNVAAAFVFLVVYLVYMLTFIKEEYLKIKKDKEIGAQKELLKLYDYKIIGKSSRDNLPPIPTATFKIYKNNEFISLTGNFSKVHMKIGKKYEVCYYKESRIMTDIKEK